MIDKRPPLLPGDLTVGKIAIGYLVGRAMPRTGPGPWWEYVAVLNTYADASALALRMANNSGHHVWFHNGGDDYEPLPEREPPAQS